MYMQASGAAQHSGSGAAVVPYIQHLSEYRAEHRLDCLEPPPDPPLRRHYIEDAAYFRAERRGFAPGSEMQDWLEAETEIDNVFEGAHFCGD